jgi:hypothetical protein
MTFDFENSKIDFLIANCKKFIKKPKKIQNKEKI